MHQFLPPSFRRASRRGVVTVEMAICLPVLLAFLFFLFEFSRLHLLQQTLTEAAYQAARVVKIPGAEAGEALPVVEQVAGAVGLRDFTVDVSPAVITEATDFVTVTVTLPVNSNSWGAPIFFRDGQLIRSATLKTERYRSADF